MPETGCLVGNLLAVIHGRAAIPAASLDALEVRAEVEVFAADLQHRFHGEWPGDAAREHYPGSKPSYSASYHLYFR